MDTLAPARISASGTRKKLNQPCFRVDKNPANLVYGLTKNLYPGVTMNEVPDKPFLLSKFKMPSQEALCKLLLEGPRVPDCKERAGREERFTPCTFMEHAELMFPG
ncbi:hypothetical protein NDU88_005156 [Pleurodeles waltl]|uniref:Uncharacterized protein n=1 Tax=Pleurodeles waltl TaxID=8319 RepID=A0AAV7WXZ4_PLEWA|nr:hypothetical protein NDU88_005156 [Pleurodeles waltl]